MSMVLTRIGSPRSSESFTCGRLLHRDGGGLLAPASAARDPALSDAQGTLAERLREQAAWTARLGSPLYTTLLEQAAADVEAGGPAWGVLAGHEADARASALALRFLGAVHRLVLEGRAPALARHYPSAGGEAGLDGAWAAFRDTLEQHRDTLRALVTSPVQTNEVGRSAALLGGFLLIARETGLPLRLLELGASAGLNLRWDHYRYEQGDAGWGDRASPVRLVDVFPDGFPPGGRRCRVVERGGCDPLPLDPCSAEGQITLLSYLWADQRERIALLRGALEVARRVPAAVDASGAPAWLAARLAAPAPGVASVVFHSIVMQYLSAADRRRVASVLAEAGGRATGRAPLAWLRMEPGGEQAEVRLTLWPGGSERLIASAGFHGRPVRWLAR